jgi:hypothetical protein
LWPLASRLIVLGEAAVGRAQGRRVESPGSDTLQFYFLGTETWPSVGLKGCLSSFKSGLGEARAARIGTVMQGNQVHRSASLRENDQAGVERSNVRSGGASRNSRSQPNSAPISRTGSTATSPGLHFSMAFPFGGSSKVCCRPPPPVITSLRRDACSRRCPHRVTRLAHFSLPSTV